MIATTAKPTASNGSKWSRWLTSGRGRRLTIGVAVGWIALIGVTIWRMQSLDGLPDVDYAVEPVLAGLVALRGDMAVTLSVEPGLHLRGDPAVLAQIVANLLVNSARHAPGADVSVTARSGNGVV